MGHCGKGYGGETQFVMSSKMLMAHFSDKSMLRRVLVYLKLYLNLPKTKNLTKIKQNKNKKLAVSYFEGIMSSYSMIEKYNQREI